MPINLFQDRVRQLVPNPGGPIGVGSTVTLGAAFSAAHRTFLTAYGAGNPAAFVLTDGAGRALSGIWTVNSGGTATITAILGNDRTGGSTETFSSVCVAYSTIPAEMLNRPIWGPEVISRTAITAQANQVIELDPAYGAFRLEIIAMSASANAIISLRVSRNAGGSYDQGPSDYTFTGTRSTAGTVTAPQSAGAAQIEMTPAILGNDPRLKIDMLFDPGATGRAFNARWTSDHFDSSSNIFAQSSHGVRNATGLVSHILLFPSSGTITGVASLYGVRQA